MEGRELTVQYFYDEQRHSYVKPCSASTFQKETKAWGVDATIAQAGTAETFFAINARISLMLIK